MTDDRLRKEALDYHAAAPAGKIRVEPTKPHGTARELSLAYSPGVAYPCEEIAANPDDAYKYTSKGNLVAVISNGTAVLGLGDIGALAGKPVMEGKGLLFKAFADIDVFDIEVDRIDVDEFVEAVKAIAPTFGGINLEDIKAPECFEIERRLVSELDIPVMHDDQHGTAIISGAALLNALEIVEKEASAVKVVISGAGASAISCATHYLRLGVAPENLLMCDSKGILTKTREAAGELNEYKANFARDVPDGGLAEAMVDADVFLGLSRGGLVSGEMVASMAERPLIFALANPDPEILPSEVLAVRDDAITATGRSDFANQINNVLGFPYIFRGALDVRATEITEGMKMAATKALAELAKEPVPDDVAAAYGGEQMQFGPEYLIPKPFDARVLIWEASAVAEAAVNEGVAHIGADEFDVENYKETLEARLGLTRSIMRNVINRAKRDRKRIVFSEGDEPTIIKAAAQCIAEGICDPILLGHPERIEAVKEEHGLNFECETIDVRYDPRRRGDYADEFHKLRGRKGVTRRDAVSLLKSPNYFGPMMVHCGDADGYLGGIAHQYPDIVKPCLQTIGPDPSAHRIVGLYMMTVNGQLMFIADATINIYPDSRTLAEIAVQTARVARRFGVKPKVAMLSFSNFGTSGELRTDRIEEAISMARELDNDLIIDGPMQADTALVPDRQKEFPFMEFEGSANVLVCPNLASANIAYKLLQRIAGAEMTGPILEGLAKPAHVLQRGDSVRQVVHMAAITAVDAQRHAQQRL
ncbi:MAG: NADP-dependent malic enzyme [Euryarchaeota archaeon]|nr:NADP-dependent malic enzyme [Euryarchaeota archaeon]MCH1511194.1 NADP-dependent malic enzyme [Candidatus Thalassarchaeaceae archaeon]MDC0149801.1 NADP-dependent malic enzyme [Candidatus Poseidoniales archaeon]MDC0183664.1 NADP-dependent malic enzyme [Candidatus Poseidoniales archaeon]RCH70978.1 MAG: NADP-dependent malic enzyme [Candidatus Poseidoniales archaeon]|tara:strand:- start:9499 stop:11781 length:2283 start_codon:yes stop_codon:yes gene_type:complete